MDNLTTGQWGERIASQYLAKKGYRILFTNYRSRWGEIDLILAKDKVLIFAEVKLKIGEEFGRPEEMIDFKKVRQVRRLARLFLLEHPQLAQKYLTYRLDAVCIVAVQGGEVKRISHYENIGPDFIRE